MKQIKLKELTLDDTKDFLECLDNPALEEFLPSFYTKSEDVARMILNLFIDEQKRKERVCFGIRKLQEENKEKLIGVILSKKRKETADLICLINPHYQGKGYASKALQEAMKQLHRKDWKIKNFRMMIGEKNKKSINLATRLGFENVGRDQENPTFFNYNRGVKLTKCKKGGER